jgi:hypothetical protein
MLGKMSEKIPCYNLASVASSLIDTAIILFTNGESPFENSRSGLDIVQGHVHVEQGDAMLKARVHEGNICPVERHVLLGDEESDLQ